MCFNACAASCRHHDPTAFTVAPVERCVLCSYPSRHPICFPLLFRQAKGRAQVSLFSLSSSHSLSSSNSGCLLQELIKVSLHHFRFLRTVRPLCSRASLVFWCITCVLCRHYSSRRCAHCHTSFHIEFCSFFFVCAGKKSGAPPPPPAFPPPPNGASFVVLSQVSLLFLIRLA